MGYCPGPLDGRPTGCEAIYLCTIGLYVEVATIGSSSGTSVLPGLYL